MKLGLEPVRGGGSEDRGTYVFESLIFRLVLDRFCCMPLQDIHTHSQHDILNKYCISIFLSAYLSNSLYV